MELKQYVSTLWKWSWLIVLSTLVAAAASFWATSRMPRIYRTATTLMVGQFTQAANPDSQDFYISQQLARSYIQMVARQPILQGAIEALGLDMGWQALAGQVKADQVPGTQLIQIDVQDTDPQRAKALADEIARQLILQSPTPVEEQEQAQHRKFVNQRLGILQTQIEEAEKEIEELEGRLVLENSARGIQDIRTQIEGLQQKVALWQDNYAKLLDFYKGYNRTNYLSVVEPASVPTTPVSPNVKYYILLAAATGFALAAGAAFLLEYLDDTIKTKEDVDHVLKLPTLGNITRIPRVREPTDHLVTLQLVHSPANEAYRVLRTNIQFSTLNIPSPQLLLVTSSGPGEGKTTTACNLAITMAYAGKKVILVDADLRRPSVHRFLGMYNQVGLTSLLLDDTLPIEAALLETPVADLKMMPSGPLPPNPADLLSSERMQQRVEQIKELADVIIFDSPPVLAMADASILATLCSGVILVVDAGRTRSQVVRRAKETLSQLNLNVLGAVLNKLTARHTHNYYYSYYYSYADANGERQRIPHRESSAPPAPEVGLLARLTHPIRNRLPVDGRAPLVKDREKA
jgi:capsular exopolysaccharide synthesis family protein